MSSGRESSGRDKTREAICSLRDMCVPWLQTIALHFMPHWRVA